MAEDRHPSRMNADDVLDDLVFRRRSIRKYKADPVPQQWLTALLQCAHQAPSPSNSQPVRFVHVTSSLHIDALKAALKKGHAQLLARHKAMAAGARVRNWINAYRRYAAVMFAAPVLLAVGTTRETAGFASRLSAAGLIKDDFRHQADVDITVGLALQNLMLKAGSLGLGSCILTAPLVFIEDVEQVLGVDKIAIKCFVSIGMPDEAPPSPGRIPLESVVEVI